MSLVKIRLQFKSMVQPRIIILSIIILFCAATLTAQDPERFEEEVMAITQKYDTVWDQSKKTIVFTGSSSIRLWEDLEERFPAYQVINSGFGGSQTSDLLVFLDELVLKYQPDQVFIYEGDNDLQDKKSPGKILKTSKEVISKIKATNSATSVVLISAKPSIARWDLRRKYRRFNRKLKKLCEKNPALLFANVWDPMLNGKEIRTDLFIEDGLHMNSKGYEIWYNVLSNYVN